jgi:hypothetical protein
MADSREYLAGRRESLAAGEAFAKAILHELERVGTEDDWAVFTISSGGPSWVWMRYRTERERLNHLWAKHTLRHVSAGEDDDH